MVAQDPKVAQDPMVAQDPKGFADIRNLLPAGAFLLLQSGPRDQSGGRITHAGASSLHPWP